MFDKNFHTTQGIADILNVDESTIREWQDQYESWIPYAGHGKNRRYPQMALNVLQLIAKKTTANIEIAEIENILKQQYPVDADAGQEALPENNEMVQHENINENIPVVFKNLLEDFSKQQIRIADAQERRASAEEKGTYALEKRADAEKLKAEALSSIAKSLSQINLTGSANTIFDEAHADIDDIVNDLSMQGKAQDFEELTDFTDPSEIEESVSVPQYSSDQDASDLEDLTEAVEEIQQVETPDLADLAGLVDDTPEDDANELPELSEIIEEYTEEDAHDLADLADLVDEGPQKEAIGEISELSEPELSEIDEETKEKEAPSPEETPVQAAPDLTDLSGLIEEDEEEKSKNLADLSALVEDTSAQEPKDIEGLEEDPITSKADTSSTDTSQDVLASDKKQSTPQQVSKNDYKKKMMAIIINLKEKKGLSIDQTAKLLNDEGHKTISGTGIWNNDMVEKIYGYINSIREKKQS